ncbi:YcjF family protein [Aeromonas simiae]|uniref:TIGR01620 family protein n=1 Tax=Aeromonas simiae TaxID=218936 RepID=A0A5J6WXE0_9GAMM|nr:TIGR01620 family protein [Aeromonas simiae]QFI54861.1 TIGR01620 family protein [Aeromonas simiae]
MEEKPRGKVMLDELAPPVADTRPASPVTLEPQSFAPLEEAVEESLSPRPARSKRRHRLLAWGVGGVGLLSLGQYGHFLWQQWLAEPLWGGAWLLASGLVICGAALAAGREWRRLRRLKKRQDVRSRAEDLLAHQGVGQGEALCIRLAEESGERGSEGYRRFCSQLEATHSDAEVLTLYSQLVLAERDRQAQSRVVKWAAEAAVMVALSPLAVVDMALILWRNLRMIDDIADVYGIELGYWSRIRLIRQVFRNLLYAGATELVTDVGVDVLGADLAGRVSARAAQGVGAGLLTARLGIKVMETCRPIPWQGEERPRLAQYRKALVEKVTGYLTRRPDASSL